MTFGNAFFIFCVLTLIAAVSAVLGNKTGKKWWFYIMLFTVLLAAVALGYSILLLIFKTISKSLDKL